jgi:hypothetical protein
MSNEKYHPINNHTIFAKWTPVNYRVIYDTGNSTSGSGPVDSRNYNIDQDIPLLGNSGLLVRNGFTFVGWSTSVSGSGATLNSGDSLALNLSMVQSISDPQNRLFLYPKWEAVTYSIGYNLNGGSGDTSVAPKSWKVGDPNVTLPTSGFTKTGHTFGGWSNTPGGEAVAVSFSNNYTDETLTAIWNIKTISYSFAKGEAEGQAISSWPVNSSATFG